MLSIWFLIASTLQAAPPNPILSSVFPSGGQAGTTALLTTAGNLPGLTSLRCNIPDVGVEAAEANQFRVTIPKETPPGQYDVQAVTSHGLSSVRTFVVSHCAEQFEVEPNNAASIPPEGGTTNGGPQSVPLDVVINGRIERGDLEHFAFTAQRGQRVVIECQAERIDSRLRAVLELFDSTGKRLAANRGYFGVDPLIDFVAPADGTYVLKLFDLVFAGGPEYFYRLAIDTRPRVALATPCVIERGKTTRVTLHGWNLRGAGFQPDSPLLNRQAGSLPHHATLDAVTPEITPPAIPSRETLRLRPNQVSVEGFAYHFPGSDAPTFIGLTDAPVVSDSIGNHSPTTAREIAAPSEVSGQLIGGDEQDWFVINARRGEVLWLEAFGERINSPVDLELSIFDASGEKELVNFRDELRKRDLPRFPGSHSDPSGRWVAPADGQYLVLVRNVIGGLEDDPRRQYWLSVRREEPDFQLVAVPRSDEPAGVNLARGGRAALDVLAFRRRGLTGMIRVSTKNLPPGIDCPDVWLGPEVDSAPLVVTAAANLDRIIGTLHLEGHADGVGTRRVRGGIVIHKGPAGISSRIVDDVTFAVAGDAPVKLTANAHEPKMHHLYGEMKPRHAPGSVVDIAVEIERRNIEHQAPVRLIGVGLPESIKNQTAIISAGKTRGTLSFYLPPTLPIGRYTFAVQGETTMPVGPKDAAGKQKAEPVVVISNTVTIEVQPAAFVVEVDPFAPRQIRRGEIVQLNYSARRINGFTNKIHTELDAPGDIIGLRGRGVTFTGGTETGTIQIIANDDAPLGQQQFLRLNSVGTLEDQPIYQGSCFLELEIVK